MRHRNKFTIRQKLQYRFDNLMGSGIFPPVVMAVLIALCVILLFSILVVSLQVHRRDEAVDSFGEALWQTFMHVIDQGTITGEYGWKFRLAMLIPTVFGLLLVVTLVGLISNQISLFIFNLRKGRSLVVERDHIVVLGWSSKIFPIIDELIKANSNQKRARIAILANKDKVEMEDEISQKVKKNSRVKIICRTGNPIDLSDLEIVNPHDAKSIIIISPEDKKSDSQNIKCILAIVNHPNRKEDLYHIVAEIKTDLNKETAQIVGGDELTLVVSSDVVSRIAVQTCLQSGLSVVYNKLLDFNDVEIYFHRASRFAGKPYKEVLLGMEDVCLIGIMRQNGIVLLNPKPDTKIKDNDRLVVIAEDDDDREIPLVKDLKIKNHLLRNARTANYTPKKILMLGWNRQGATIVKEMDQYVPENSELCIVSSSSSQVASELQEIVNKNLKITFKEGDITNRKTLNDLQIPNFTNVMILSYGSMEEDIQEIDANTLVTLMHLRDIKKQNKASFSIISEMLDIKNRTLAEVAQPDDFIISDHIISLLIAQMSENKELKLVYDDLFDAEGAEFYLKPVYYYLNSLEEEVNFFTIAEAAIQKNETAIGYRVNTNAYNPKKDYGIVLNPHKSDLIKFSENDKIIVLAEDE